MGNKKIGLGLMLNLIGAMFAYLIGSGFASGQETMQYFSGWNHFISVVCNHHSGSNFFYHLPDVVDLCVYAG